MALTTVSTAVSDRQLSGADDVVPWANKEIIPLLKETRAKLNIEGTAGYKISTAATATFTSIWTSSAMPTNSTWHVYAKIQARTTAGVAQQCAYERSAYFSSVAGVVSQVGATATVATFETAAAADVQFLVSGQTVALQVKDDGASTFAWKAIVAVFASDET